jgi:translocator protein
LTAIASRSQLRMSFLRYALVTVPLILLLGMLSGRASNSGYGNAWFAALTKPAAMPDAWLFGAAWTILYLMLGLALAIILHAHGARLRGIAIGFFAAQFLLNLAWSPLFFGMHRVGAAFLVIILMLALAIVTASAFWRVRRPAGLLMLPYVLWLGFAAFLNYEILRLNPNAETLVPSQGSANIQL